MSNQINFDAESLIQSQSPKAPFIAIFEQDENISVFYAIRIDAGTPSVVDQLILDQTIDLSDVVIHWNEFGDRAALIVSERIISILDYKNEQIFSEQIVQNVDEKWVRKKFEFNPELAVEFGLDQFFKQPFLDEAIDAFITDNSETNRMLFYKNLLKSKLFVPITTNSSDDPNTLIYTFPNDIDDSVDVKGNLVCAFTNLNLYKEHIGQYGLSYQKVSADYLCFGARSFTDILGITITSTAGNSILISRDEFKMLSLISQPQRMDTNTLLSELGNVFFEDLHNDQRDQYASFINQDIVDNPIFRAGYYCKSKIGDSKPLLCLVLTSSNASENLTTIVDSIKQKKLDVDCDCHIFSLSDIVAQALEQSKQPL